MQNTKTLLTRERLKKKRKELTCTALMVLWGFTYIWIGATLPPGYEKILRYGYGSVLIVSVCGSAAFERSIFAPVLVLAIAKGFIGHFAGSSEILHSMLGVSSMLCAVMYEIRGKESKSAAFAFNEALKRQKEHSASRWMLGSLVLSCMGLVATGSFSYEGLLEGNKAIMFLFPVDVFYQISKVSLAYGLRNICKKAAIEIRLLLLLGSI